MNVAQRGWSIMSWMFALAVLGCGGLTAVVAAADAKPQAATKPNIIHIMIDDAGIGDIGVFGGKHIKTPNIDRLAAEGMKFTRAYSGSAVCAPTRSVLMQGLHTGHARRRNNQSKDGLIFLEPGDLTVAESLKKTGYATGGFGKWGLGNPGSLGVPEKQGFDVWYGYYDQVHAHDYYPDHLIRNSEKVALPGNTGQEPGRQYTADLIAHESLEFVEANKDRPFFLYAAWTLPHGKYEIPSDAPYTSESWPQQIKNYAAMVTLTDKHVGMLMQKLKQLGIDDNTVVFFSSDNGANSQFIEALDSSAGLRGTKRLLYEGGIRTPQIVRWPGKVKAGSTSDILTSHVDFFPTAVDIAGGDIPQGLDGISILPTLLGRQQSQTHEHLYYEIYEPGFQQAVVMREWKGYRTGTKAPLELYNLAKDPAERHNIATDYPQIVKKIEAIMAKEHVPSPHWEAVEQPRPRGKKNKKESR